jgi:hypothetical protein
MEKPLIILEKEETDRWREERFEAEKRKNHPSTKRAGRIKPKT